MDPESILREKLSWSTPAERKRFLKARKGDIQATTKQLSLYQNWLMTHDLIKSDQLDATSEIKSEEASDLDLWNLAVVDAWLISKSSNTMSGVLLPRIFRYQCTSGKELRTKDGKRIVQCLPAQIDWSLAPMDIYTTALALYMFKILDRDSEEKIYILIDVRAGWGWKNPPAWDFVSFVKKVSAVLERNFPERLDKCIIYPLPWGTEALWTLIKPFIDPDTANKVRLISGPALRNSPPPDKSLAHYIDPDTLIRLEENRTSSFMYQN